MVGVCVRRDSEWEQRQWSYVFSNFGIKDVWETADELPDVPLVVLAPQDGTFVKGEQPLDTFVHPDDAVYLFGGSQTNLTDDDFGGREPDHLVYIPSVKWPMFAHAAGAIVLYDRYVKRGEFG